MKKFKIWSKAFAIILIIVLLFSNSFLVFGEGSEDNVTEDNAAKETKINEKGEANYKYFKKVKDYIEKKYKFEVSSDKLLEGVIEKIIKENPDMLEKALGGMFEKLDEHSTYFSGEEYESFSTSVEGKFGGIGIIVEKNDEYITILAPMDDTPGKRAGLKAADKIVFVNELNITGYDINMAVSLMRGEPGMPVRLGVMRKGFDELLYFDIVRDIIKLNPVAHKVLDGNIGYIRIASFNSNTDEYFDSVLEEFDEQEVDKIIIDVRNNPGGSLEQVVRVASNFVADKGPIVHIEYKDEEKQTYYSRLEKSKYKVAILVNEGSASASEILAGAIQDSKAGVVIGAKSFGKGTVQEVLPVKTGGAVKMTIARYLTPSGRSIHKEGIRPDIVVKNIMVKVDVSDLDDLVVTRKPTINDKGKDILAAEQRLKLLGYDIETPDEDFDEKTFIAVRNFQAERKLHPYGVLDFTTQIALEEAVYSLEREVDKQLEEAIDFMKKQGA